MAAKHCAQTGVPGRQQCPGALVSRCHRRQRCHLTCRAEAGDCKCCMGCHLQRVARHLYRLVREAILHGFRQMSSQTVQQHVALLSHLVSLPTCSAWQCLRATAGTQEVRRRAALISLGMAAAWPTLAVQAEVLGLAEPVPSSLPKGARCQLFQPTRSIYIVRSYLRPPGTELHSSLAYTLPLLWTSI